MEEFTEEEFVDGVSECVCVGFWWDSECFFWQSENHQWFME